MSNENKNTPATQTQAPAKQTLKDLQDEVVSRVLERVNSYESTGELMLPANFSAANALRSAWMILLDTVDKNGKPVLEVCTKASIANAMFDTVLKGLSPVKKQCYFIAYGNELSCDVSYFGDMVQAKRVGDVKEFRPAAVYEGDVFKYEKDSTTGRTRILEHKQDIENLDHEKVKGAYVIIEFNDGSFDAVVMSMKQIRTAWAQGAAKGGSPAHKNFTDEMAMKTVIGRACKKLTNSTDDSDLFAREDRPTTQVKQEINQNANKTAISMNNPPPKATIPVKAKEPIAEPAPEPVAETPSEEEQPPY